MLYGTNNSLAWLWYKVDEKWSNKQNRPRRPSPTRPLLIAGAVFSVLQSNKISQSLARQSDNQSLAGRLFLYFDIANFSVGKTDLDHELETEDNREEVRSWSIVFTTDSKPATRAMNNFAIVRNIFKPSNVVTSN